MGKVTDIADMKQRVAAAEAKLKAAAQEGRRHNERLLDLLDVVEGNLAHNQQLISRLEEEHGRALEEIPRLRNPMMENVRKKKTRPGRVLAILGLMGWLATAAMVTDKVQSDTINDALKGALLRSQVTRHELSQELARVSADLDATRKRLDRYRSRETQSAGVP